MRYNTLPIPPLPAMYATNIRLVHIVTFLHIQFLRIPYYDRKTNLSFIVVCKSRHCASFPVNKSW